ncbi:MAG: hypothetical protein ABEJ44_04820 [Halanaeroarchaeum sp.]
MSSDRPLGESEWAYESIVRSIPGINTSRTVAVAVQFIGFEAAILVLAAWYDLPGAAIAGTVAVIISVVGSLFMLVLSRAVRWEKAPSAYREQLFGSRIEVFLGLLAFFILVVYVFVYDPRQPGEALLTSVLGAYPPVVFVFLFLIIGWDVAYRIGVGWWTSVIGLWRSSRYGGELSPTLRAKFLRLDVATIGYAALQLLFVPILAGHPLLQFVVIGHTVAVALVSGASIVLLR